MACSTASVSATLGLIAGFLAYPVLADDTQNIPDTKRTKAALYLTASEAFEVLKNDDVLLIDVRSRPEVSFVGIPERVNVHIPLMVMPETAHYDPEKRSYDLEPNPSFEFDFLDYAETLDLPDDAPIVIICRSGSRSAKAANIIYELGYTQVYSVIDGFEGDKAKDGIERGHRAVNGWKNAGLDWSYSIAPEQVYPSDLK